MNIKKKFTPDWFIPKLIEGELTSSYLDYNNDALTQLHHSAAFNLLRSISINQLERICDIGCAVGSFTSILKYKFPNSEVIGIDFSKKAIQLAVQRDCNCIFKVGSLEDIPLEDSSVNLLVCMECVYYLDDSSLNKFVHEALRVCDIDSFLLVTINIGEGDRNMLHQDVLDLFRPYFVLIKTEFEYSGLAQVYQAYLHKVIRLLLKIDFKPAAKLLSHAKRYRFIYSTLFYFGYLFRKQFPGKGLYLFKIS